MFFSHQEYPFLHLPFAMLLGNYFFYFQIFSRRRETGGGRREAEGQRPYAGRAPARRRLNVVWISAGRQPDDRPISDKPRQPDGSRTTAAQKPDGSRTTATRQPHDSRTTIARRQDEGRPAAGPPLVGRTAAGRPGGWMQGGQAIGSPGGWASGWP